MSDRLEVNATVDVEIVAMTPPTEGVEATKDGATVFQVFFGDKFDPEIKIGDNFTFDVVFRHIEVVFVAKL